MIRPLSPPNRRRFCRPGGFGGLSARGGEGSVPFVPPWRRKVLFLQSWHQDDTAWSSCFDFAESRRFFGRHLRFSCLGEQIFRAVAEAERR